VQSSMPPALSKKPEETRLRLFVSFLFLCCAGTVLASHIFYRQHIGEVSHPGSKLCCSSGSILFFLVLIHPDYGHRKIINNFLVQPWLLKII
jgi:hypothetical protein